MNKDDFHAPQAEKVVYTLRDYWVFISAPLPPDISYDPHLVLALSRADAALSELSGLGRHVINPHLLIDSYIRKEAVLSSRIEGTRTGIADLLINVLETPDGSSSADLKGVQNYVTAL
jgi:Fic family protein